MLTPAIRLLEESVAVLKAKSYVSACHSLTDSQSQEDPNKLGCTWYEAAVLKCSALHYIAAINNGLHPLHVCTVEFRFYVNSVVETM